MTMPRHVNLAMVLLVMSCRSTDRTTGAVTQGTTVHLQSAPTREPPSPNVAAVPALTIPRWLPGSPMVVDGKLDEPGWKQSASTGEFVNVGTGAKAAHQQLGGQVLLAWSEQSLIIGATIRDSDIRGDFAEGSTDPHLWTESTFEIMIDPDGDGDNRDYYEIQVGPQNLIFDSQFDTYNQPRVLPDGPFGHQQWSALAKTAVVVRGTLNNSDDQDDGYTVEAQIPWSSFSKAKVVPPRVGETWRMNFYAMRNNGGLAWSPILGQGNFHKASRFGRVTWAN